MKNINKIIISLTIFSFFTAILSAQIQALDKNIVTVSESQLFADFKKAEIANIKEQKNILLNQIKNGDKKAESSLKQLSTKENIAKKALNNATINYKNSLTFLKINPIGPCPPKTDGKCGNDFLQNLVVPGDLKDISGVIYQNKKQIGYLSANPIFVDKKNDFKIYDFNLQKDIKGDAVIQIQRTYSDGSTENYELLIELTN